MMVKPKPPSAIVSIAARVPQRCPACICPDLARLSESGGVTRLTCPRCAWSEHYLIVARVPDDPRAIKGGDHLSVNFGSSARSRAASQPSRSRSGIALGRTDET